MAVSSPLKPYMRVQVALSWLPRSRKTERGSASFHAASITSVSSPLASRQGALTVGWGEGCPA